MITPPRPHNGLRRLTSLASVAVAASLIAAKLLAYFDTHSLALLSSLLDSGTDMLASMITAYGIAHAMRPADREHRFGHGKAESLAALAQAAFITGASILLVLEAIQRMLTPQPITDLATGYWVMGLSILLTAALLILQSYTVKKTGSLAIASDRLHYVGDILINLAVIVTFAAQQYLSWPWADPLFAMGIAVSMLYGAIKIARRALDILMDAELPDATRADILKIARKVPGVADIHDMRTRFDSDKEIIEMHVEMNPKLTLSQAHDIAEQVMKSVRAAYPRADILVHQDPKGIIETRLDHEIERETARQGRLF